MEQNELILDVIRESCSNALEVKGSVLGAILKVRFPQLNLRRDFGGMKKYIQSECPELLQFSHKQGGDDVFRVVDGKEDPLNADPGTVWRVFGNPTESGNLFFDASKSAILLASGDSAETNGDLRQLPRITHAEQKSLILQFAREQLGESEQELIGAALESENYWQLTTGIFRSSKPSRISAFAEFRKVRWLQSLEERLIAAGATSTQAGILCASLGKPAASPKQAGQTVAGGRDRQAIIDLIGRMSDAELDQLSLPLWTVAGLVSRLTR